jgi:hypothetical protein
MMGSERGHWSRGDLPERNASPELQTCERHVKRMRCNATTLPDNGAQNVSRALATSCPEELVYYPEIPGELRDMSKASLNNFPSPGGLYPGCGLVCLPGLFTFRNRGGGGGKGSNMDQDEAQRLARNVRWHVNKGNPVTDRMLVEWKRGQGMHSNAVMNHPRESLRWLNAAREIVKWEEMKCVRSCFTL